MAKDKQLERQYSLNVARLSPGKHEDSFEIDTAFFQYFDSPLAGGSKALIQLAIEKFGTHMDVRFSLSGTVSLPCDRCGEDYSQELENTYRIIYSFSEEMKFEGYEVMFVNPQESNLNLMQEFFDIIQLSVPFRKVPPADIHLCDPKVLEILGMDKDGNPLPEESADEAEMDPRWAALKKLKDQNKK